MRCLSSSIDLGDHCRLMCSRLIDGVHYGFPAGCHRYEIHRRLGVPTIRCKIRPLRFTSISCNSYRSSSHSNHKK
ncbi:hypothetical protein NC651_034346 [Populus alba x Populus x berolinensis]|nr:hypothetical protein NC651_034346 [Populus alba x Populus x berolinensis]